MTVISFKNPSVAGWDTPNLGAPEYPQALNGRNGLIFRPRLDEDGGLQVSCPIWSAPDFGDEMQIEYSRVGEATWTGLDVVFFEFPPVGTRVIVTVPFNLLGNGEFDLRFKVKPGSGGDFSDFSSPDRVRIDLFGPYKSPGRSEAPERIVFPDALPINVDITQDVLNLNPGGFYFEIPAYSDWEDGDRIAQFWFTSMTPPDDAPSLGSQPMGSTATEFNVPISAFDDFEDGNYFAYYRLIDAAGNRSEISRVQTGRRLKRKLDLILQPLKVLELVPDNLIDIEEWRAGVRVAIPSYAYQPGDQYRLHWGSQVIGPLPLDGVFDFVIAVVDQVVLDEYGLQEGLVETMLTYDILRSGSSSSPDEATLIDVDLSVPGPKPPLPGEDNPDLDEVHVFGPVSGATRDYLTAADINDPGDIEARFNLWLINPAPVAGNVITLYWGSKLNIAGTHEIQPGEGAGDPIIIVVDKAAIASAGNNFIDVFYGVSVPESANSNLSNKTPVEVDDAISLIMDPAQFRNAFSFPLDPNGRITCASLRPTGDSVPGGNKHIEVFIPPNDQFFDDGTVVTVKFHASTGLLGDEPIDGSEDTIDVTLDLNMARSGFIFELKPFDPHLKAAAGVDPPYASMWLQYSVDFNGTPAKSVAAVIAARMVTANNYCDGSPYP